MPLRLPPWGNAPYHYRMTYPAPITFTTFAYSGIYPSNPRVSGFLQEWLEPSGIITYDASGCDGWERNNTAGVLKDYVIKWIASSDTRNPFYESGVMAYTGMDGTVKNVWFNGVSGIARYFDPGASMNQGGDDAACSWVYVLEDKSPITTASTIVGFYQSTIDNRYFWMGTQATPTYPSGTIQIQKRTPTAGFVLMSCHNALPKNTPSILVMVHSGTSTDLFRNGVRVCGPSGMDVGTLAGVNVAGMGLMNRATKGTYASGLRIWEAQHYTSGLSWTDRIDLENNLSSRYGIPLAR